MSVRLLSVGEVMAEIRQDSSGAFQVGFAGDTFNTAVYCARELGQPGAVGYLSCLGEDPLSRSLMPTFEDEGIDVRAIRFDQERNIGIYSVSTDEKGERSFHYWRSQSAARLLFGTGSDLDKLEQAEIVYLSGITLAILEAGARDNLLRQLGKLRDAGRIQIAFDSNYRPSLWESRKAALDAINGFWEIADIALPSIDDEMDLYGRLRTRLFRGLAGGNGKHAR